eukprot:1190353-Amphidinium_carterae.1
MYGIARTEPSSPVLDFAQLEPSVPVKMPLCAGDENLHLASPTMWVAGWCCNHYYVPSNRVLARLSVSTIWSGVIGTSSVGLPLLPYGVMRMDLLLSALDFTNLGLFLFAHGPTCLGSLLLVFSEVRSGSCPSASDRVEFGSPLLVQSLVRCGFLMPTYGMQRFSSLPFASDFFLLGSMMLLQSFLQSDSVHADFMPPSRSSARLGLASLLYGLT